MNRVAKARTLESRLFLFLNRYRDSRSRPELETLDRGLAGVRAHATALACTEADGPGHPQKISLTERLGCPVTELTCGPLGTKQRDGGELASDTLEGFKNRQSETLLSPDFDLAAVGAFIAERHYAVALALIEEESVNAFFSTDIAHHQQVE